MSETETTSRRDQILDAAFSLVQTNDRWSLTEAASKIGITKTAIYRHFKNKAEIEAAMQVLLYKDLQSVLDASAPTPEGLRKSLTGFFRTHPGHLFLIMHSSISDNLSEQHLINYLEKESARVAQFFRDLARLPENAQRELTTHILKNAVSIFLASFQVSGIEEMQDELISILGRGFPELSKADEERMDELEAASAIHTSELGPGNKLLEAIAETIKEFGISSTTIERIAEKMGKAKSSLYFYFSNKNEMLLELVKKETETIIRLCASRAGEGKNLSEQIFIIMVVQANYLLINPNILPVFNWIRYETVRHTGETPHMPIDLEIFLKPYHIDELFPHGQNQKLFAIGLLKWASILSTSVIIQGLKAGENEGQLRRNIRTMYKSMLNGDKEV